MKRFAIWTGLLSLPILLSVSGCGGSEKYNPQTNADGTSAGGIWSNDMSTLNGPGPTGGAPSPGAAPTFGAQAGNGFSTGDALNSTGMGTGLMGYHGVGSMGTSNTITDAHDAGAPDKSAKDPVLPAQ
jgi:hypothetical protein